MQNSSLKKSCTKPGTFSGPKRLKKGSGFLFLHYFFVQVAIAFLFCNSPLKKYRLCVFDLKGKGDGVCGGSAIALGVNNRDLFVSHGVVLCQLGSNLLCNFFVVRPVLKILQQIKEELIESGFIRRKQSSKKVKITSKPFHYISSDGFHMYVGKNNLQNEELTFHFANGGDWWFHAKKAPGSHVIVKTNGEELPDRTFEEAARLAAHYSKNSGAEKVEVDYVEKKQVKKPNGSKPGFVVYYTNYSMMIDSDISGIQEVL